MLRALYFCFTLPLLAQHQEPGRKLLESAADIASAARPEIHTLALIHLGKAYSGLDDAKCITYLRQAFAITASTPEDSREALRGEVVTALADESLPDAIDLLRSMVEPATLLESGSSAAENVVAALLEDSEFDQAIEVIGLIPESANYPFRAATLLFEKLPKDDSRRTSVFGRALTAYKRRPSSDFTTMLWKHWRLVPRESADSAAQAVVAVVKANKDDSYSWKSEGDGKTVITSAQTTELGRLYHVLDSLDPARAKLIASANPAIKAAASEPPEEEKKEKKEDEPSGLDSDDFVPPFSLFKFDGDINNFQKQFADWSKIEAKADEAFKAAEKDPQKALSLALEITHVSTRADAICKIARKSTGKDPQTARGIFEKCMTAIADIKNPVDAMAALVSAAEAAHALKQKEVAIEAFSKALATASEAYSLESNAESLNQTMRDYWPSVQFGRAIAYQAGKLLGPEAQLLFREVNNPDMSVLFRIEMALAFLGEPNTVHHVGFRFTKSN